MKERVTVLEIENFTKPLFQVAVIDILFEMRKSSYCFILSESYSLGRTKASSSRTNYNEVASYFQIERNIANEIKETVHRLQLPFRLDQLTEGRGNCFPISIMQQCRRPEIFSQLESIPKMLVKHRTGHSALRFIIKQFIMKSKHPRIARKLLDW